MSRAEYYTVAEVQADNGHKSRAGAYCWLSRHGIKCAGRRGLYPKVSVDRARAGVLPKKNTKAQ